MVTDKPPASVALTPIWLDPFVPGVKIRNRFVPFVMEAVTRPLFVFSTTAYISFAAGVSASLKFKVRFDTRFGAPAFTRTLVMGTDSTGGELGVTVILKVWGALVSAPP